MNCWMELSLQFRMMMMMEGKCGCRGAVSLPQEQGREPRATSKGILTQLLSVSAHPSEPDTCLAQQGPNSSWRKPKETHLPRGKEGNSSHPAHKPAPHLKTWDPPGHAWWITWTESGFPWSFSTRKQTGGNDGKHQWRERSWEGGDRTQPPDNFTDTFCKVLLAALKQPVSMSLWGLQ